MMSSIKESTVSIEVIDNLTSSTLTGATVAPDPGVIVEGSSGNFVLKSNSPKTSRLILNSPGYVSRTTYVNMPNGNLQKIGLIPESFDMVSFNRMARNSPPQSEYQPVGKMSKWNCGPSITVFDKIMPWSEGSNINSVGASLSSSAVTALADNAQNGLSTLSPYSAIPSIKTPIVGAPKTESNGITVGVYTGMLSAKGWAGVCYTYYGEEGVILYAHIGIDSGYQGNSNVMTHEVGHALGLMHITISSIMYPNVSPQQYVTTFDTDSKKIIYDRARLNSIPDIDPPTSGFFGRSGIQQTSRAEIEFWLRLRNTAISRGYEVSSTSDRPPTEAITNGYECRIGCGMDGTEELDVFRVIGTFRERVGGYARRMCPNLPN